MTETGAGQPFCSHHSVTSKTFFLLGGVYIFPTFLPPPLQMGVESKVPSGGILFLLYPVRALPPTPTSGGGQSGGTNALWLRKLKLFTMEDFVDWGPPAQSDTFPFISLSFSLFFGLLFWSIFRAFASPIFEALIQFLVVF